MFVIICHVHFIIYQNMFKTYSTLNFCLFVYSRPKGFMAQNLLKTFSIEHPWLQWRTFKFQQRSREQISDLLTICIWIRFGSIQIHNSDMPIRSTLTINKLQCFGSIFTNPDPDILRNPDPDPGKILIKNRHVGKPNNGHSGSRRNFQPNSEFFKNDYSLFFTFFMTILAASDPDTKH